MQSELWNGKKGEVAETGDCCGHKIASALWFSVRLCTTTSKLNSSDLGTWSGHKDNNNVPRCAIHPVQQLLPGSVCRPGFNACSIQ